MRTIRIIVLSLALSTAVRPAHALTSLSSEAKVMLAGAVIGGAYEAYQYRKTVEEQNQELAESDEKMIEVSKPELFWNTVMGAIKGGLTGIVGYHLLRLFLPFSKKTTPATPAPDVKIRVPKDDLDRVAEELPGVRRALDEGRWHTVTIHDINEDVYRACFGRARVYQDGDMGLTEISTHDVFNVDKETSMEELKKIHQAFILKWHPDKYEGNDPELARLIINIVNNAWDTISKSRKAANVDTPDDNSAPQPQPDNAAEQRQKEEQRAALEQEREAGRNQARARYQARRDEIRRTMLPSQREYELLQAEQRRDAEYSRIDGYYQPRIDALN